MAHFNSRLRLARGPFSSAIVLSMLLSGFAASTWAQNDGFSAGNAGGSANNGSNNAFGGGAQADFDTLIELIQSTVAPDTWDDVGGDGSIQGFPGGVFVDSSGILKRLNRQSGLQMARFWQNVNHRRRNDTNRSAVEPSQDPRRPSRRRHVSLTGLLNRWQKRAQLPPDTSDIPAMQVVAGLERIDYVVLDAKQGDVILIGPAGDWKASPTGRIVRADTGRPVLQLEDLIVLMTNARRHRGQFMCAITPTTEGLAQAQAFIERTSTRPIAAGGRKAWLTQLRSSLGLQRVEVQGIEAETRVARVIVEADHHMKQIGIGLIPGPSDVVNYLQRVVESGQIPEEMQVLRWWFTLHPDSLRALEAGKAYEFAAQTVQLLSENELLTQQGQRVHTGESEPLNRQFAADFTENFDLLAERYPVYADLDNLFRLALVAALIQQEHASGRLPWQLDEWFASESFRVATARSPQWVESIVHHRSVNRRRFVAAVSGGVHFTNGTPTGATTSTDKLGFTPTMVPRSDERWWWD